MVAGARLPQSSDLSNAATRRRLYPAQRRITNMRDLSHMNQSTRWIDNDESVIPEAQPSRRLSSLKFFMRYPIFLLMFGPPIFRSSAGIDATKGNVDIWAFIQVGWLSLFAIRAILRLVAARSIFLPKSIRSILRLAFILGLLYLASVAYSP